MRKLKILLGDLSYFNEFTYNVLYTPLAVGFIATYIKQLFGSELDIKIIKNPDFFIKYAIENKPDLIGLSLFYWNTELNHAVIKKIRQKCGKDVVIIYGGPSVDTDLEEQRKMFRRFPEINAVVPDEGELGFSNIVRAMLSDKQRLWDKSLDGVVYLANEQLIRGASVGLSTDLSTLNSPYLIGFMDDYLKGPFQPLIQTSRLCPYSCAFCVSGKTVGKLRAFPIDQVKEEINYVCRNFKDRPHFTYFIADENFGILKRDADIAEYIRQCSVELGYPRNVFFYNDKRFAETSHRVVETISKINFMGLALSLQTENPEALKAIHRTNLTSEQIDHIMQWAAERDIPTTTELIFGLPYETKDSFVDLLERSAKRGFDSILCHNLFVMDGIEMNREPYRQKHKMQTAYRILSSSYGMIADEFIAESEEVVVSTAHFSQEDFFYIRCLSFMFYVVYSLGFYKWFFNFCSQSNISISKLFYQFLNPDPVKFWPKEYLQFVTALKKAFQEELFSSKESIRNYLRTIYENNHNKIVGPSRINVKFGAKLIYLCQPWVGEVLKTLSNDMGAFSEDLEARQIRDLLLDLCGAERISIRDIKKSIQKINPMIVQYDIIKWRVQKYKTPLRELKIEPVKLKFQLDSEIEDRINSFNSSFSNFKLEDYYYYVFDFMGPRHNLLFGLRYDDSKGVQNDVPS